MKPNNRTCDVITNKDESLPALLLPALSSYTCDDSLQIGQISTSGRYHSFGFPNSSLLPGKRLKIQSEQTSVPVSSVQYADHSYDNWQKESEKTKLPKLGCPTDYPEYYKTISSGETTDSAVVSSIATNRLKRKRQRDGPSCDSCRTKKIKCNATIIVFLQDRNLISSISSNLHYALSQDDINQFRMKFFKKLPDVMDTYEVIKHLDKIVLFKACTSCSRRNQKSGKCLFSRGFTKSDMNVFSKINSKLKGKTIFEMTVADYIAAGFQTL
ncbi:Sut2p [Saccharomyces paradoxus]|uniref:Sut2p n=1 Tax=Saccharomyces paradoxus TaxID=27291 RepID=A0A8B8V1B3_SACPA|nr:Sut2 [Saccharomyces paradoxus]QHS76736.1 Sut2 [Saccharomyces paradoxus]